MTNKLLNWYLSLGRDIQHKLGMIFNFENKTIVTWQEVSISMTPPHCVEQEFFVIKENCPLWNVIKRIKQIIDAEYKKTNLKTLVLKEFLIWITWIRWKNIWRDLR